MKLYLETCSQKDGFGVAGAWHKTMSSHPTLDRMVFTICITGLDRSNHIELSLSEQEAEALKAALLMRPE